MEALRTPRTGTYRDDSIIGTRQLKNPLATLDMDDHCATAALTWADCTKINLSCTISKQIVRQEDL